MIFNKHLELKGKHALISPSKYYQLKYDVDSIPDKLNSVYASDIGTVVHSSAALNIEKCHKIKTKSGSIDIILNAFNLYVIVNTIDCIFIFTHNNIYLLFYSFILLIISVR